MKTKCKSPLPWFGADSQIAAQLAVLLDYCKHITIPFCGGMGILPHLKAKHIIANDLHEHVYNFYQVAKSKDGDGMRFREMCRQTLSHPSELDLAAEILSGETLVSTSPEYVRKAWAFWAQCWIGRKGKGGTRYQGGKPSVRRAANGGNNASRLKSAAKDLEIWADMFTNCEFACEDYRECLEKTKDISDNGIYLDPPGWVTAGTAYLYGPKNEQERVQFAKDVRKSVDRFKNARVVIRYGDEPLIRELYSGWNIIEGKSRTQANKTLGELWITNG